MHMWPLETDTQTLTARVQTPPTPTQRATQTTQTTPPDLADGDAYRKRTQSDDWVSDGNRSGEMAWILGPKMAGEGGFGWSHVNTKTTEGGGGSSEERGGEVEMAEVVGVGKSLFLYY